MGLVNQGLLSKANGTSKFSTLSILFLQPESFRLLTTSLPDNNPYRYEMIPTKDRDLELGSGGDDNNNTDTSNNADAGNTGDNASVVTHIKVGFNRWFISEGLGLDTIPKRRAVFAALAFVLIGLFIWWMYRPLKVCYTL